MAENCITLQLGWGRESVGRYGNGVGHDVQRLRSSTAFHIATGARVTKTNVHYPLVQTQEHDRMEGRPLAIDATPVAEVWRHPIETVAKSERGLDRTRQGESLTFRWPAHLGEASLEIRPA